jgi:bifunctional DNA-binding transcriptional regulator/antitoxin component of YhaV-PrlF toxin-antitoxin module
VEDVKKSTPKRRRGTSRVSAKYQVTIPIDALQAAGIEVGERMVARADGPGRVVLERERDVLAEFAGRLTGVYEGDELERLRDEWD